MKTLILKGVPYELDLADFTRSGHRRHNLAFICPRCLSKWAFICAHEGESLYSLFGVPCTLCSPTILHPVPGSLLDRWAGFGGGIDEELLDALPRELLVRELELHIKAYDNENARSDRRDTLVDAPGKPLSEAARSL